MMFKNNSFVLCALFLLVFGMHAAPAKKIIVPAIAIEFDTALRAGDAVKIVELYPRLCSR